jgi:hypothetical protein
MRCYDILNLMNIESAPKDNADADKERMDHLVEMRGIRQEDLPLIQELERTPKSEVIKFHNFFDIQRNKDNLLKRYGANDCGKRFGP